MRHEWLHDYLKGKNQRFLKLFLHFTGHFRTVPLEILKKNNDFSLAYEANSAASFLTFFGF